MYVRNLVTDLQNCFTILIASLLFDKLNIAGVIRHFSLVTEFKERLIFMMAK